MDKHNQNKRTIFITCFHNFVSRTILSNKTLEILAQDPNVRIIIFCPSYKEEFLNKLYGRKNIIIKGINPAVFRTRASNFFQKLNSVMLPTYTIRLRRRERLYNKKSLRQYIVYFAESVVAFLGKFKVFTNLVRLLDFKLSNKDFLKRYVAKYNPLYLFATNIFSREDALFLMSAKFNNIRTIGMVRSWDQTTNKRVLRILPDKMLVANQIIKEEAVKYHGMDSQDIDIIGMPQFDLYVEYIRRFRSLNTQEQAQEKADFFKKIGADINKRLILLAPLGRILTDIDWEILEVIKNAHKERVLPNDFQYLVRNHPNHPADLSKFQNDKMFIIENPGIVLQGSLKHAELDFSEINHLCDSLNFCDLVVQFSSSIGLDASIFNKPQIMIAFDGWENKPYIDSVRRYHDEINMKHFISLGPATVVNSKQELFFWIKKYIQNPKINENGRKKVVNEILWKLDGKCGERIARFILNEMSKIN